MKSDFVLNLRYALQQPKKVYLIFDLCSGGDLKFHLNQMKHCRFPPLRARFYAAQILLGLEHIHSLNVVYRDLKPNNILLDEAGNCKISDLGLAVKLVKNKVVKHLAGTPGYFAPEIVQKSGTYKVSDFWSFGVMLYEMINGRRPRCHCDSDKLEWCPFESKQQKMETNALDENGMLKIHMEYPPELFSPACRDLLEKIFVADPKKRLGASGIHELKMHPYFVGNGNANTASSSSPSSASTTASNSTASASSDSSANTSSSAASSNVSTSSNNSKSNGNADNFDLPPIDWEKYQRLDVEPPYVPDSRTIHANSLADVGEMRTEKFRTVKLSGKDQESWSSWDFVDMESREAEIVRVLERIDEHRIQKETEAKRQPGQAEVAPGCCTIL